MKYSIKKYTPDYFDKWNELVNNSNNGTIFHRLDFLSYHDDKYIDSEHHLMFFKGETLFAIMPMAVFKKGNVLIAKSPYGASFGGIVFAKRTSLEVGIVLIDLLLNYLKRNNIKELNIIVSPSIYSIDNDEIMIYLLLKAGFKLIDADVFNSAKLPKSQEELWNKIESRARNIIRKKENEFDLIEDASVDEFYPILLEDKIRHKSVPSHSLGELIWLKKKFPDDIIIDIAVHKKSLAQAGLCHFCCNNRVNLTFYMAQEDLAVGSDATTILVYNAMKRAIKKGASWFDFGGSSYGYKIDNIGVSKFKESFSSIRTLRYKFKISL